LHATFNAKTLLFVSQNHFLQTVTVFLKNHEFLVSIDNTVGVYPLKALELGFSDGFQYADLIDTMVR